MRELYSLLSEEKAAIYRTTPDIGGVVNAVRFNLIFPYFLILTNAGEGHEPSQIGGVRIKQDTAVVFKLGFCLA